MKRILCLITFLVLIISLTACDMLTARTIVISDIEGDSAFMIRDGNTSAAGIGQRLSNGTAAVTGGQSHIFLGLNKDSTLKMDEHSAIEVSQVSSRSLSISLLEGAISADIKRRNANDTYEIHAGNTVMGIRGTSFAVDSRGGDPLFVMLLGSGDIGGTPLEAGNVAQTSYGGEIGVAPLVIDPSLGSFILGEIVARKDELIRQNILTEDDIAAAEVILDPDVTDIGDWGTAVHLRGLNNQAFSFRITGMAEGSVWGSDIYTDDSVIARAAVHAGLVEVGQTAIVTIRILPGLESYPGTERNGVITSPWGEWPGSFEFIR
jgi:hypothetical protein